jgi:hypothetical protein
MTTKAEMLDKYEAQLSELGVNVDTALLEWCVDRVGPANYDADGQAVACSSEDELARVFTGFVGDELEEENKEEGMKAIHAVCEQMQGISRKYRAVFYYLLAKRYGQ